MTPTAALLSYRLGGTDGVSVEAAKWEWALRVLGFSTRRIAGEICDSPRGDDISLPGFAIHAPEGAADARQLTAALDDVELVVVENLCSLPLNAPASFAAVDALARHRGRVVFHHHDLPWQRADLAGIRGLPPDLPGALHVVLNDRSAAELAARGITSCTIRNTFDFDAPPGDRARTRAELGFGEDDVVVLQPTRAIARKDVPGGLRFGEELAALLPDRRVVYWLTGPAEDGYGPELARVTAAAALPVVLGRAASVAGAYAAADVVVFPSTWEGFGNPVVESVIARRPLAVRRYPTLDEILAAGVCLFDVRRPDQVAAFLDAPDPAMLERNLELARRAFSLDDLPGRLEAAFADRGWTAW
jgi:glycosyltransferase involved in cell wall biosynthesis